MIDDGHSTRVPDHIVADQMYHLSCLAEVFARSRRRWAQVSAMHAAYRHRSKRRVGRP